MFFLLLLILPGVRTQDPSVQNYSPRPQQLPFNSVQFLQHKQAKQGPILFPNDAPPPPPTPLIVTARPLSESIARSELNPNNSVAAQSQYHQVTFRPNYLARGKNYEPYSYTLATVAPVYDYESKIDYSDTAAVQDKKENFYKDYEKELMDFIHPSKRDSKRSGVTLVPIQRRRPDQPKHESLERKANDDDTTKQIKVSPVLYSKKASINTNDSYYEDDFSEEDNNFDFDFRKLYLRVVKPFYEFDNVQRQQNTAAKSNPYKLKDSPDQLYYNKNNEDEHDYNKDSNHADNYAFSYTVKDHKTGDDFSHSQKSTGSATNGEYRVRLPDGRMQIVSYTADENGYKADVRYDEHHNQDNSIDFENDKDKAFRNNDIPKTYNYKADNAHVVHQDSFENEEYLHQPLKPIPTTYKAPNHYEQPQFENINDYGNKNDRFLYYNVYPTKTAYAGTTGADINDRTFDGLSDNNNDYLEHYNTRLENNDKIERAKNDYKFSDEVIDYSSELDHAYQPHKSKFASFANNQNTQAQAQVRPSYDELKDLFVTNVNGRRNAAITAVPVVSTVRPVYAVTPENIVAITPKNPIHNLYTNIKNIASATPTPFLFSTPSPSTPRSYLLSTIANLKHQISLANKPVLSDQYINKINKYLSYSNPSKLSK